MRLPTSLETAITSFAAETPHFSPSGPQMFKCPSASSFRLFISIFATERSEPSNSERLQSPFNLIKRFSLWSLCWTRALSRIWRAVSLCGQSLPSSFEMSGA